MTALRVLVADDHFLVRDGLRRLLSDGDDVEVVGEAASGPELTARVRSTSPDAVLTDVRMPPTLSTEGIEAALAIRAEHPSIGVVVLSQHADAAYAQRLFHAGTAGLAYLLKEQVGDRDELVRALRGVAGGGSTIDARIVDALLDDRRRSAHSPLRHLTSRELDVLREMARGRTNAVIALDLHVSESAVSKHVSSIFSKLDLAEDARIDRRVRAAMTYVANTRSDEGS